MASPLPREAECQRDWPATPGTAQPAPVAPCDRARGACPCLHRAFTIVVVPHALDVPQATPHCSTLTDTTMFTNLQCTGALTCPDGTDQRADSPHKALRKRIGGIVKTAWIVTSGLLLGTLVGCAHGPTHVTTAQVCGQEPIAECSARHDKEFEAYKATVDTHDDPVKRAALFDWYTAKCWDKAERKAEIHDEGDKDEARAAIREQGARACAIAAELRIADDVEDAIHHLRKSCSLSSFVGNAGIESCNTLAEAYRYSGDTLMADYYECRPSMLGATRAGMDACARLGDRLKKLKATEEKSPPSVQAQKPNEPSLQDCALHGCTMSDGRQQKSWFAH